VSTHDFAYAVDPLSVSEVARWLGLHPHSVKRIPPIDLPFFRVGTRGDRRYRMDDVRAYIERRAER
jgi:hypothetical protein